MTPEERDRLTTLEVEVAHLKQTQEKILAIVTELNTKSNRIAGGIVILAAIGGLVYYIVQTVITAKVWSAFT